MRRSAAGTSKFLADFYRSFRFFYLFTRRNLHQRLFSNNPRFVSMAAEPPAKRQKKEIAETSENGAEDNILATYMAKRQNVCESVADFKFDKKRVRLVTSNAEMSETCKGITYWMWREQRVQGNATEYVLQMTLRIIRIHTCYSRTSIKRPPSGL